MKLKKKKKKRVQEFEGKGESKIRWGPWDLKEGNRFKTQYSGKSIELHNV